MTAFSRADVPPERRPAFSLYVDEFQRFQSSDFATFISEARKFNISTFLSHQTLTQLTEQNRASALAAGTIICFRVSGDDSRVLSRSYDTTPTQQIVGEEPIRATPADPLSHLVRHGSVYPPIQRFVAEFLMPLESLLRETASSTHLCQLGWAFVLPSMVIEGRRQVNECLARCMREGTASIDIPGLALFVVGGVSAADSTYIFYHDRLIRMGYLPLLGLSSDANIVGRANFLASETRAVDFLRQCARTSVFQWQETVDKRVFAFLRMLKSLRQTMAILATDPILVDTGSYQPKYQMRTYADMEGEISNSLANQANYHAKVKIVNAGEYSIKTRPAPGGLTGNALTERIEAVKRHMRALGYTRPYTEVMEELRKRQEYLLGLGDTLTKMQPMTETARMSRHQAHLRWIRNAERTSPPRRCKAVEAAYADRSSVAPGQGRATGGRGGRKASAERAPRGA